MAAFRFEYLSVEDGDELPDELNEVFDISLMVVSVSASPFDVPQSDPEDENPGFHLKTLKKNDDTSAEYHDILDRVLRYRKEKHRWNPKITKIEKIINPMLKRRYKLAKNEIGEGYTTKKFHGTGEVALQDIIRKGFRLPEKQGMYGAGVYLATNSSKAQQYSNHSGKLLLCRAFLGKSLLVKTAQNHMTGKELAQRGYDSVYAKRGTKATGGVYNDEFVLYNPALVLPEYVIHYH